MELSKVFKQPTLVYPITLQELPDDRGAVKPNWTPEPMLDLRRFKEVIDSYTMHSPFMKEMLNLQSGCNRVIPKDLIDLVIAFYNNYNIGLDSEKMLRLLNNKD